MNVHNNARLTFRGRELLVKRITEHGLRVEEAAQASGVSVRTACKWLARYPAEGIKGLVYATPIDRPGLNMNNLPGLHS